MSSSVIEMHMTVVQHVAVTEDSLVIDLADGPLRYRWPGIRGRYTASPKNATIGA
jgi:hypothetical protein